MHWFSKWVLFRNVHSFSKCSSFSKCVFILRMSSFFEMCIHFQNVVLFRNVHSFSKWVLFRNVHFFSKCENCVKGFVSFFHLSKKHNCKQSQLTKVCKTCIVYSKSFWWGRVNYDEINKALEFVSVVRNPQFITSSILCSYHISYIIYSKFFKFWNSNIDMSIITLPPT